MNTRMIFLLLVLAVPILGMDNASQESYWTRHVEGEFQVDFNNRKLTLYQRDMQFGPVHQAVCIDDIQLPAKPIQKTQESTDAWSKQCAQLKRQYRDKKIAQLKELLDSKKYDVNSVDSFGRTPLYYAARDGLVESVQLLINAGADCNIQEVVPRLRAGVDYPDFQRVNGIAGIDLLYSPLEIAVAKGQRQIVSLLLEQGNCSADTVRRALSVAEGVAEQYKVGHIEFAAWDNKQGELVAKGKQKVCRLVPDNIALAASKYQLMQEVVAALYSRLYPQASRALTDYREAWFTAACEGDVVKLKDMVSKPGYQGVDIVNNQDKTALLCAVENNQVGAVAWLLQSGAKNQVSDALLEAARMPQVPRSTYQITPAGNAAHNIMSQRRSIFELLLQYGADINARDADGFTLLHRAVYDGQAEAVGQLIEKYHAHIYELDSRGNTILHIAVGNGNQYLVGKILEHENTIRGAMQEKEKKKYARLQSVKNNAGKKAQDLNDGLWRDEIEQELARARLEGSMVMVDPSPSESEKKLTDSLEDGEGFFEPKPVSPWALSALRSQCASVLSWATGKLPSSSRPSSSSVSTSMATTAFVTPVAAETKPDDLLSSRRFETGGDAAEIMHEKEKLSVDEDDGYESCQDGPFEGDESPSIDPLTASVIVSTAQSVKVGDQGTSPDAILPSLLDDTKEPEFESEQDIYQDYDDTIDSLESDDEEDEDDMILDDTQHSTAQAHDVQALQLVELGLRTLEPVPAPRVIKQRVLHPPSRKPVNAKKAVNYTFVAPQVPRLRLPAPVVPASRIKPPVEDSQQASHFHNIFADTSVGQPQGENPDPRLSPHNKKSDSLLYNTKLVPLVGAATGVALVYVAAKTLYHTFCSSGADTTTKNHQDDDQSAQPTEIAQPDTAR